MTSAGGAAVLWRARRALCGGRRLAHGHSHGGAACGHSHGPDPPPERGTLPPSGEEEAEPAPAPPPGADTGLPLPERVRNILASHWSAQLSSISLSPPSGKQPRKPAIHGTLSPFALLPGATPLVFLADDSEHAANLGRNPLASVTVGHAGPGRLAALLRTPAGVLLPRVSLLGELRRVPEGEESYATERAAAAWRAAGRPANAASEGGDLHPWAMNLHDCRWVDARGAQHPVTRGEVEAAAADALCSGSVAATEAFNSRALAPRYARMVAAFVGDAGVTEAVVTSFDRSGVTLAGRSAGDGPNWREFRFAFNHEVGSHAGLARTLDDMADEAEKLLAGGTHGQHEHQ